jgi:Protein of unknown function (DUF664)
MDATIATLPLDSVARVPWWPADRRDVPLHQILVHLIAETSQAEPVTQRSNNRTTSARPAAEDDVAPGDAPCMTMRWLQLLMAP